ncbi:delta(8)-fatty-acid desaturase-like [Impatiens glandulifera]|uniref:delta(8)-fatty-acid desaturase-like n=1 Tax=Impatiens glandulifera TaxID=253017 RepID=UPI001FB0AF7B|nr:delta(8)-fatty-acid desaturase-like [Impatiens glandulifera]
MADEKKYITLLELSKHNEPGDLWISIQGKVYNVTDWVKEHPGGDIPLLNLAGQEATDAFIAFHPPTVWHRLDKFFTGYHLKDYEVTEISKDYRRLASEFSKAGLFEKKGHVVIQSLSFVCILFMLSIRGVLFHDGFWMHMLSGAMLGFAWVQVSYLGHDSGHYNMMTNRRFNKVAQILSGNCLTGISMAWWKWTHNAHHIAVNSLDYDPDLQHLPVFAVSTSIFHNITSKFYDRELTFDPISMFMVSYQHITFYPVMCVGRINLFIQTFLLLFSNRKVPDRALNILGILVFWTWFPLFVSYLPNWTERFLFVLISFTVTAIQHIQFCLNHFSADTYVGPPRGNDWFEKQMSGTIDISCSTWMDWFHGGLQFQLEHHLFPRLPRCQLRKISPLVRDLCKKHNLPYNSLSFYDANCQTIRTLKKAAMEARSLLWEAVNTHG